MKCWSLLKMLLSLIQLADDARNWNVFLKRMASTMDFMEACYPEKKLCVS